MMNQRVENHKELSTLNFKERNEDLAKNDTKIYHFFT